MVRAVVLLVALLLAQACTHRAQEDAGTLILRGFVLVDPESGSLRPGEVVIEQGRVVAQPSAGRATHTIEGHGHFLLPALWDLEASLWGNESALNWEELTQELGITHCLRVQLSYGVGHVVGAHMDRDWVKREQKRAAALELDAAELLYPDKAVCGTGGKEFACHVLDDPERVAQLFASLVPLRISHLLMHYADPDSKIVPAVSKPVLERALAEARRHRLPSYVYVDTWTQAEEAVELGASALHGLPSGTLSDALIAKLVEMHVAYAPNLSGLLELPRLLGDAQALADPFLALSVPRPILATFENQAGLWEGWQRGLTLGRERQEQGLADLRRLAQAGVPILSASNAGWSAGTFQGYSAHATQVWLQRAGLDAWQRLRAATLWPAQFLGRHIGFRPGDPADFVALEQDPTTAAEALRTISFVIRTGRAVDPAELRPDVTRSAFRP